MLDLNIDLNINEFNLIKFQECFNKLSKERKESIDTICKNTGIDKRYFSKSDIPNFAPKIDNLIKLANLYDLSIDYILGRVENPKDFYIGDYPVGHNQNQYANAMTFVEFIKIYIKECNYKDVEKLVGYKSGIIKKFLTDIRHTPTEANIIEFSQKLKIPLEHLIGENPSRILIDKIVIISHIRGGSEMKSGLPYFWDIQTNLEICKMLSELKINQNRLKEWMHGRQTPDYKTLQSISKYFGVPIDCFLKNEYEDQIGRMYKKHKEFHRPTIIVDGTSDKSGEAELLAEVLRSGKCKVSIIENDTSEYSVRNSRRTEDKELPHSPQLKKIIENWHNLKLEHKKELYHEFIAYLSESNKNAKQTAT